MPDPRHLNLTHIPDPMRLNLRVNQVEGDVDLTNMSNPRCLDLTERYVQDTWT